MDLGLLALGLTIAAFAAQAVVIGVAGAVGKALRDLDFLPYVEVGFLAAATVVALVAQHRDGDALADTMFRVDIGLLGAFVLLQLLRALAIGLVSRRFRSVGPDTPTATAADLLRAQQDGRDAVGEDVVERGSRCRIRRVDPVPIAPKVLEGSSAPFLGVGSYYLFRLSVVTAVVERAIGAQPSVRVVAEATGAEIPYLTILKAGAAFLSALTARAFLPADVPRELLTFPTFFAAFGIEVESITLPPADVESTVRCRDGENGRCLIVGKPNAVGPIELNQFSAAAAINARPVQVGGGVGSLDLADEIELECKGYAAFKGKLVVEKVTLGGTLGVPAGPVNAGATAEVVITAQATEALVTGGGTVGFRCVRSGAFPQ